MYTVQTICACMAWQRTDRHRQADTHTQAEAQTGGRSKERLYVSACRRHIRRKKCGPAPRRSSRLKLRSSPGASEPATKASHLLQMRGIPVASSCRHSSLRAWQNRFLRRSGGQSHRSGASSRLCFDASELRRHSEIFWHRIRQKSADSNSSVPHCLKILCECRLPQSPELFSEAEIVSLSHPLRPRTSEEGTSPGVPTMFHDFSTRQTYYSVGRF